MRRAGAGVKAMFGACGLWRFRRMFDMGQPPRKQGNGITIDYLAGRPQEKAF